jgi:osmotically-inducible protein OsmY
MEMQINSPAVLCERVRTRLSLDKGLAKAEIEVEVEGDVVTLRGEAPDLPSRRRAVELTEGTVGVGQVVDELGPKE